MTRPMKQIKLLSFIKSAGKFFFDLEPEITEVLALRFAMSAHNTYDEVVPVIVEAYRCQKSRLTSYLHRHEQSGYQLA